MVMVRRCAGRGRGGMDRKIGASVFRQYVLVPPFFLFGGTVSCFRVCLVAMDRKEGRKGTGVLFSRLHAAPFARGPNSTFTGEQKKLIVNTW